MKKLLIGTTNIGKLKEYKKFLHDIPLELVSLKDVGITDESPEPADSFEKNAIIKAKFYYEKSGIPTLVDDGGFEIDALGGEPGVRSHRWLGEKTSDEDLIAEVIKRMKNIPPEKRTCRLTVVLAVAGPFGIMTSDSAIEGIVPDKSSAERTEGYPFRSVMYLPNYRKYYINLNDEEHEILNHRKHAIEKIKDFLIEISK
jgi:XTP/dITP diphosphohydrolase